MMWATSPFVMHNIIYYTNDNEIENLFKFLKVIISIKFINKLIIFITNHVIQESLLGIFRVFKNEYKSNSVIVKIKDYTDIDLVPQIKFDYL